MRQVAWGNRRRHDTANVGREEGEGFSGTTVQTPTTGGGEDWRGGKEGRRKERERGGGVEKINGLCFYHPADWVCLCELSYLSQPQRGLGHCRVYTDQSPDGTALAGSSQAEETETEKCQTLSLHQDVGVCLGVSLRTCPFSVMLVYMALLGLSLCGGSSISISLLCLYLSGRDGEPTAETHRDNLTQEKHTHTHTSERS